MGQRSDGFSQFLTAIIDGDDHAHGERLHVFFSWRKHFLNRSFKRRPIVAHAEQGRN